MPIKFEPTFTMTPKVVNWLVRIESVKEKVLHLPLTPTVLNSLREAARLYTTHYSTMIEGNRLEIDQIDVVLNHEGHFPGRERDEHVGFKPRTSTSLCTSWVESGFLVIDNPSNKARSYKLAKSYEVLVG